jgi:hypothetical protein
MAGRIVHGCRSRSRHRRGAGDAFAVGAGHAPNAVRLALASPPPKVLVESLQVLSSLARSTPRSLHLE